LGATSGFFDRQGVFIERAGAGEIAHFLLALSDMLHMLHYLHTTRMDRLVDAGCPRVPLSQLAFR
jgi:hypothetical protein